jgi:hypothetical protein
VVGPLRIQRDGNRLRFGFDSIPALWGGVAGCTPRRDAAKKRWRNWNWQAKL